MSDAAPQTVQVAAEGEEGVAGAARAYFDRLKAGDMGSLPVIFGMALIVIFFTLKVDVFFTAGNFENIVTNMAGTALIAIGVVFVLLLGEIDLSVGVLSGLCGVCVAWFANPATGHTVPGVVAILLAVGLGTLVGLVQGSVVALVGVPSFVVTLAGLIAYQGLIIRWIGQDAAILIQDKYVNDVANYFLSKEAGWIVAAIIIVVFAGSVAGGALSRRKAGLPVGNVRLLGLRVVLVAAVTILFVAISNHARGVAFAGLVVITMLAIGTFVARRTTFGRHVYAVGGNAEAARRAGINVAFIRICVFMISGAMAALGGVMFASRINGVDLSAGGSTTLLDAIAAAVIGGTSLFGGRGRVIGALLGAAVIDTIANGLQLIGSAAWIQYVVTGAILLAATTLDTVSRRKLAASGR